MTRDYCPICRWYWHDGSRLAYGDQANAREKWWKAHSALEHGGAALVPVRDPGAVPATFKADPSKLVTAAETGALPWVKASSTWGESVKSASSTWVSGTVPLHISGKKGLEAILQEVRDSKDPFLETGAWITKVTNALTEQLKELEKE